MYFVKYLFLFAALLLMGCQDMGNDLNPSSEDRSEQAVQPAPDFTLEDTRNEFHTLSSEYQEPGVEGVVFYFTMWCTTCRSHMLHLCSDVMPSFPNVTFWIVDFVSGSVADARRAPLPYQCEDVTMLADIKGAEALVKYSATMGTTVVVDRNGYIQMREDYKDGRKLRETLEQLP